MDQLLPIFWNLPATQVLLAAGATIPGDCALKVCLYGHQRELWQYVQRNSARHR